MTEPGLQNRIIGKHVILNNAEDLGFCLLLIPV